MQHTLIVRYQCFLTTHRSHLKGSSSPVLIVCPEMSVTWQTDPHCVTSHKSEDPIYNTVKTWKHVSLLLQFVSNIFFYNEYICFLLPRRQQHKENAQSDTNFIFIYNIPTNIEILVAVNMKFMVSWNSTMCCFVCVMGPCHHGMARPQVADRGTASFMEGSCE